jgi:uncharacterized protein YndB with AHSA1/START domain
MQVPPYTSTDLYKGAAGFWVKDDLTSFLGLTVRTVKQGEYAGKPAKIVIAAAEYDTDIEDLWDAITDPRRIARWLGRVTGELELGGHYQIQGNASGVIRECVKPTHLGVTWEYGEQATWVNVDLTPLQGDRTNLRLEHVLPDDDKWRTYGPGAVGVGWELALLGLFAHLRAPQVMELAEGIDKVTSPEGRAFVERSTNGWREADIASGTAESISAERAHATLSFYTRDCN